MFGRAASTLARVFLLPTSARGVAQHLREATNAGAGKVGVGENEVERHHALAPFAQRQRHELPARQFVGNLPGG